MEGAIKYFTENQICRCVGSNLARHILERGIHGGGEEREGERK